MDSTVAARAPKVSQRACQRAEANVAAARSLGLLGLGSSVEVLVRRLGRIGDRGASWDSLLVCIDC